VLEGARFATINVEAAKGACVECVRLLRGDLVENVPYQVVVRNVPYHVVLWGRSAPPRRSNHPPPFAGRAAS
jgi:hypothetical protein